MNLKDIVNILGDSGYSLEFRIGENHALHICIRNADLTAVSIPLQISLKEIHFDANGHVDAETVEWLRRAIAETTQRT